MDARITNIKKSIRAFRPPASKQQSEKTCDCNKRISLSRLPPAPLLIEIRLQNGKTVKHVKAENLDDCGAGLVYVADVDREEVPRDKSIPTLHLGLPVVALPRFNISPDEREMSDAATLISPCATQEQSSSSSPIWRNWHHASHPPPSILSQESAEGTSSCEGSTMISRSSSITSATTKASSLDQTNPVKRGDKSPLPTRTTDYHSFMYSPKSTSGNQLPTINDVIEEDIDAQATEEEEEEYHLPVIKAPRRNWVNFSFRNNSEFLPVE